MNGERESLANLPLFLRSVGLESLIVVADQVALELERRAWPGRVPSRQTVVELQLFRDRTRTPDAARNPFREFQSRHEPEGDQPLDYAADG